MNEKTVTVLTILSRIKAKSRMEPNSPGGRDWTYRVLDIYTHYI